MHHGIEHAKVVAGATKAAYGSSLGLGVLSYLTLDQWALISAITVGFATYFTNLFFKIRDDRRKTRADKRAAELHRISGMNKEAREVSGENIDVV